MVAPLVVAGGVKVVNVIGGLVTGGEQKRIARNIADRVAKYRALPTAQLQDVINIYGGEAGEAARIVIAERDAATPVVAPASETKSATAVAPAALASHQNFAVIGLAVLALFALLRFKGK